MKQNSQFPPSDKVAEKNLRIKEVRFSLSVLKPRLEFQKRNDFHDDDDDDISTTNLHPNSKMSEMM